MGLADELFLWIAKNLLGAGIDKQNGPEVVDDGDPFGERLQKGGYPNVKQAPSAPSV